MLIFDEESILKEDIDHLVWLHDRIVNVYKENKNTDYLIKMRKIIKKINYAKQN